MKRWMIGLLAAFALPYFGYLFAVAPLSHLNQLSFGLALLGVLYYKWTHQPACNATVMASPCPTACVAAPVETAPTCCDPQN